ncbi:putative lipase/esterase [Streptomyces avidinii]
MSATDHLSPAVLSPAARRLCDAMAAGFPAPGDVAALRAAARGTPGGAEVASVRDAVADGVPVRIYDPAPGYDAEPGYDSSSAYDSSPGDDPAPDGEARTGGRPLAVYFHGGGWVMCGLDTHDALCRALAAASGAVVVSADYRLAPEHPWPAAADDALAAVLWGHARAADLGCDPARLVVAGDSSGGSLAAVTALRAPGLPAGQLLFYPPLDASMASRSVSEFAEGYFHTAAHMAWYWDQYVGGGDPDHPHVSPLAADGLSGLPRTLIVLADCDVLRDEGLAYGRRLAEAGVDCAVHLVPGVFHGFLGLPLPAATTTIATAAAWMAGIPARE